MLLLPFGRMGYLYSGNMKSALLQNELSESEPRARQRYIHGAIVWLKRMQDSTPQWELSGTKRGPNGTKWGPNGTKWGPNGTD